MFKSSIRRIVQVPMVSGRRLYSEARAGSDSFGKREKAAEDQYVRKHEQEQLKKLREQLEKTQKEVEDLEKKINQKGN
ncbi:hypothetical protein K502DRAFT_324847 [Neoconidiobolus thromboides FSU 785]|nr:hypothetical protein K502DRAFT_324847 [Neoconidiobolus thromboides FSU 785]